MQRRGSTKTGWVGTHNPRSCLRNKQVLRCAAWNPKFQCKVFARAGSFATAGVPLLQACLAAHGVLIGTHFRNKPQS